MRLRVWWFAAAATAALLASVSASALRPTQVEGASRVGRRYSTPSVPDISTTTSNPPENKERTSFRSRGSRRKEETPQRDVTQTRSRSRAEPVPTAPEIDSRQEVEKSDRFISKRTYSRVRSRPDVEIKSTENTPLSTFRSRSREFSRRSTTQVPFEVSSPSIDETKIEVISSNLDDITKMTFGEDKITTAQFRRRSSTAMEPTSTETIKRSRKRVITRVENTKPQPDLVSSDTTNNIAMSDKDQTTAKNTEDVRISRKLRYKTRLSETDSNLTGQGISVPFKVTKSSQIKDNITSQSVPPTSTPIVVAESGQSAESNKPTTTLRITKVIRRPLSRSVNFRPSVTLPKKKSTDEIGADDNYPESFKALIYAQNASTPASSQSSESLLVKASQKVYKTFTIPSQSSNTEIEKSLESRFQPRTTSIGDIKEEKSKEINDYTRTDPSIKETSSSEIPITKRPDNRARAFTQRNRRTSSFSPSSTTVAIGSLSSTSTAKPAFKFSRSFKITTTSRPENANISRQFPPNSLFKKPLTRPSYYTRQKLNKTSTEPIKVTAEKSSIVELKTEKTLPKTSYYARLRSSRNNITSTTESASIKNESIERKSVESLDEPLIFTSQVTFGNDIDGAQTKPSDSFLIKIDSKESLEKSLENEVGIKENDMTGSVSFTPLTKYHASYKDISSTASNIEEDNTITVAPLITNIQTRKLTRQRKKILDGSDEIDLTEPKPRDSGLKKFKEPFSKQATTTTNGITPEPEKSKSRFSAKYRSTYLDKPFYRATVPTVTPTTAWLKFFVTDRDLTKSVQGPAWFDEEQIMDMTTETIYKQTSSSSLSSNTHESSSELVEGEESQLGPNMNAISFTQTRSTLSSADLRLSESIMKPLHVMNVEASNHSPSVTISIFDALAEILTSTPRPKLSSTTDVTPNIKSDVKQTLNGVSSTINVNSEISIQDTFVTSNDITTNTKTVQTTDQTTPNVINRMSVGDSFTSSSVEEPNKTSANIPFTTPDSSSTTPVSARRPFAIKVLYSNTESPLDKLTAQTTVYQAPIDNPTMVLNTVSDIFPLNNNLVSSELTSMLANNINSILDNMDESLKSKLSVDMAKMLKVLIPRALSGVTTASNDFDIVPNTTPYSLEDIRDTEVTENDKFLQNASFNMEDSYLFQNVSSSVNSTENKINFEKENFARIVNMSSKEVDNTVTPSNGQTTLSNIEVTTEIRDAVLDTTVNLESTTNNDLNLSALLIDDTPSVENINSIMMTSTTNTENLLPIPSLIDAKISDFTLSEFANVNTEEIPTQSMRSLPTTKPANLNLLTPQPQTNITDIQDSGPISPLQLWILSKKANVLKMIEDILSQHNEELASMPALTEIIGRSKSLPLAERLSKIIDNVNLTVNNSMTTMTTLDSSSNPPPNPILTTLEEQTTESGESTSNVEVTTATSNMSTSLLTTPGASTSDMFTSMILTTTESSMDSLSLEINNGFQETLDSTNTEPSLTTTSSSFKTTTLSANDMEIATQSNIETTLETQTTTEFQSDTTTSIVDSPTSTPTEVTNNNISTQSGPPKKDYVIFGILPNNTVVRKDPNDDILESLTESSPYIVYGVLPNNTIIRRFPNGTRVPRVMQKIDVLPISPWSLRNPYSPIHNNPAIVRPQFNPIRVSINDMTSTDISSNGTENQLTTESVNIMNTISSSPLHVKDSRFLGVVTTTSRPPAEKSTASHVLKIRTSTMLPSVDEILLNSLSSAAKEEMVISSMTSSTSEPRILTLDIDPETKQIRTEKPSEENGGAIFKFIPIDEVAVVPQNSNVFKLATKTPSVAVNLNTGTTDTVLTTVSEQVTQTPQIPTNVDTQDTEIQSTSPRDVKVIDGITSTTSSQVTQIVINSRNVEPTTTVELTTMIPITTTTTTKFSSTSTTTEESTTITVPMTKINQPITTTSAPTTTTSTEPQTTTTTTTEPITTTTTTTTTEPTTTTELISSTTTTGAPTTIIQTTTNPTSVMASSIDNDVKQYEQDVLLLQNLLSATGRNPKNINLLKNANQITTNKPEETTINSKTIASNAVSSDDAKLLQAILSATGQNPSTLGIPSISGNLRETVRTTTTSPSTSSRSIEEDIRQFEEDTKLLKALLQATGQNPANFNIPNLNMIQTTPKFTTTQKPTTTVQSIDTDIKKFQEDAKLLEALLQATGQKSSTLNLPVVSGVTSNVRIASNPMTTSLLTNPTTPALMRPVYKPQTTTSLPVTLPVLISRTVSTTFQPKTTPDEGVKISTTFQPFNRRTTTNMPEFTTRNTRRTTFATGRRVTDPILAVTTDTPNSSTFSVEEDLVFLQNLKTVLNTNNSEDPETALANRIIALAVEKSLNEIQSTSQSPEETRVGKAISSNQINRVPTTTTTTTTSTTTSTTTTTTPKPTVTTTLSTPSIEEDLRQFQQDAELLQTLLKATGQDPSQFKIPTLPGVTTNVRLNQQTSLPNIDNDLKLLSNLLASPSPLNEPFDQLTQKTANLNLQSIERKTTTPMPFGAKIVVKEDLKSLQDDAKLLKTLIKLQGAQETTTQKNKLTITGQTADEALTKLLQGGMVSEATRAPATVSTEYGKSNDALIAALLKEQGFGPTTASSLDEQLRLAALLNQVVVTPKARRTTTPPPPPPPPPPRRPVLDGLAWLWQQWRDTAPGPGAPRPNRRPAPAQAPTVTSSTSNRVNWFGSGPFVGNADDRPTSSTSKRIPLEPPRAVTSEQTPARGQLVSAAINVTRAFSQFLGAAIQGAAQTVQNVIRAGQRAATDVYTGGSG